MKTRRILALLIYTTYVALLGELRAAGQTGTVRSVNGETVLVAMDGDVMPRIGAQAEFFFKLAGSDAEISVATGRALKIDQGYLQVKIENATGSVEKGQLVRFSSAAPHQKEPGGSAATASPSPGKSAAPHRSVVGEWRQVFNVPAVVFTADGTMQTEECGQTVTAKYRVDYTTTPNEIDLFEFAGMEPQKDAIIKGIVAVEDNQLRLFLGDKEGAERPTEFGLDERSGSRVGNEPSAADSPIVGKWRLNVAITSIYTFTPDGTVRTYFEARGGEPSKKEYRYQIDQSATPMRINFFFGEINDDPAFRGIIEFESDTRMRLDGKWTKEEAERPTTFGPDTYVFVRSQH